MLIQQTLELWLRECMEIVTESDLKLIFIGTNSFQGGKNMRVEKDSVHMGKFLEVFYHFFTFLTVLSIQKSKYPLNCLLNIDMIYSTTPM
jgi:hypothetical protein